MPYPKLIIIRGIPGSGKSTLAKKIQAIMIDEGLTYEHYEADMYHTVDGIYKWTPENVGKSHAWCLKSVKDCLSKNGSCIVSNTFTTKKELKPYFELIPKEQIEVIEATGKYQNIHSVPVETLRKMSVRYETDISSLYDLRYNKLYQECPYPDPCSKNYRR